MFYQKFQTTNNRQLQKLFPTSLCWNNSNCVLVKTIGQLLFIVVGLCSVKSTFLFTFSHNKPCAKHLKSLSLLFKDFQCRCRNNENVKMQIKLVKNRQVLFQESFSLFLENSKHLSRVCTQSKHTHTQLQVGKTFACCARA